MKYSKNALLLFSILALALYGCRQEDKRVAIPVDKAIEAKVDSVLRNMTLDEKVGQMIQLTSSTVTNEAGGALDTAKLRHVIAELKVGSILNTFGPAARSREETARLVRELQEYSMKYIGIPCIYGMDMIHGASYLTDAVLFPQEINLAATFDRNFAAAMGKTTAYETRAAMIPWVFSPVMDLARTPVWPRIWESWGEDPYLASEMAVAETKAMQGNDPNHIDLNHVGVSIKHYLAYGAPASGQDRTPAYISASDLREKYFRPFKDCMQAGALTLMVNSASINGVPTHANHELLTVWAKEQLGWDGMIVTDWADMDNLYQRDHVAEDAVDALAMGINAGIDMVMDPMDPGSVGELRKAIDEGLIPMSRVDDAVRRVLRLKFRLGLFDHPTWDVNEYDAFASNDAQVASFKAAVESEVLLKNNDNILPIEYGTKILVTGPNANSMRTLNGGWSYTWQGDADKYAQDYNTIYEALSEKFGDSNVIYEPGVEYDFSGIWQDEPEPQISKAVAAASKAQVIVCCVGENSYCETPGNINDLNLSANQKELVKALAKTGKPIVLVLNEGRPRVINDIEPLAKAIIDVMLPGNYGSDALAALLSGEENFSGKLPFTYPRHVNSLHSYDYKVQESRKTMPGEYNYDAVMDFQWPFGSGISYTEYEYSGFKCLSGDDFIASDILEFQVTVKNVGNHNGKEAVLLYSSDMVASLIPDARRLRAFTKIELGSGESKTVDFKIPAHELAFVGADGKWRLEEGGFRMSCGDQSLNINCTQTHVWDTPNID